MFPPVKPSWSEIGNTRTAAAYLSAKAGDKQIGSCHTMEDTVNANRLKGA